MKGSCSILPDRFSRKFSFLILGKKAEHNFNDPLYAKSDIFYDARTRRKTSQCPDIFSREHTHNISIKKPFCFTFSSHAFPGVENVRFWKIAEGFSDVSGKRSFSQLCYSFNAKMYRSTVLYGVINFRVKLQIYFVGSFLIIFSLNFNIKQRFWYY